MLTEDRPRPRKQRNNYFTKKIFLKIPDPIHGPTAALQMALKNFYGKSDSTLQ